MNCKAIGCFFDWQRVGPVSALHVTAWNSDWPISVREILLGFFLVPPLSWTPCLSESERKRKEQSRNTARALAFLVSFPAVFYYPLLSLCSHGGFCVSAAVVECFFGCCLELCAGWAQGCDGAEGPGFWLRRRRAGDHAGQVLCPLVNKNTK